MAEKPIRNVRGGRERSVATLYAAGRRGDPPGAADVDVVSGAVAVSEQAAAKTPTAQTKRERDRNVDVRRRGASCSDFTAGYGWTANWGGPGGDPAEGGRAFSGDET
jgi:hypothetical protein